MFSEKDKEQIVSHGLTVEKAEKQIADFIDGFGYLPVEAAAAVGSGIMRPSESEALRYRHAYDTAADDLSVVKFVPASGAATRMFKDLFTFAADGVPNSASEKTVANLDKFAFYPALPEGIDGRDDRAKVEAVLEYGAALPKGLIYFHSYPDGSRTAFGEHLSEGALYARTGDTVRLHFTISEEHRAGFETLLEQVRPRYEELYGVRYEVTFSVQDSGTDTIAVTPENEPFRNADGSLLFRPAGHGALIENLNSIDADIIFIKNIDNVAPDRLKGDTITYKKLIAGILLEMKRLKDEAVTALENREDGAVDRAAGLLEGPLCCRLPAGFSGLDDGAKRQLLLKLLDRPMRVCGMVPNEGEPGGGPFWAANADGTSSLQIAEPSQVAPEKAHLLSEGTHFNPVDIVCAVKDHKGRKFDLREYTDPSTGFISEKSKDGRKLRALELPGLWNGAMANWITVFAEVPVSTFTPVKEVTDLLRPEHRQ
ncbi:MAG: DUF4301 family protein [Rikenellaceae bacterium]|nr:DUF4301 family protein [Rikenellaceae bacterium]